MLLELKDYQTNVLDAFVRWRDALDEAAQESQQLIAAQARGDFFVGDDHRNVPLLAWRRVEAQRGRAWTGVYANRTDDAGRPIPHVCLKVPTGGGKTLLAAAVLERLGRQSGLTLWIVPTRAIYAQTRTALKNREHPYRKLLELASGGRLKLLEKDDRFTAADTANYHCVMLLMLPAANRQKGKEFLRMFRDSGRYPSFFPEDDDIPGAALLLESHPDLERVAPDGPARHSLFNVFKMLRPVVILDEAHKAYGKRQKTVEEFARSVSRLDPRLVVELSATPIPGISNLLVDIGGAALKAEEMIKLPVRVTAFSNVAWTDTLIAAHRELDRLAGEAEALQADNGRYIRPIAVVRVERTGKDQRDGERVHAEDVRDYLVRQLGVPAEAVAVKSAERDELAGVDLLSPYCPVRWIITRAALMEGWDCPFAYVLAMLDNTTAKRALTQLVGRVMRQPYARRTGREALDRCYVYCWNSAVGEAVEHVKAGLEAEGLTGLGAEVLAEADGDVRRVALRRREPFRDTDIFLPLVLHRDGEDWRELDYTRDILSEIDWCALDAPEVADSLIEPSMAQTATVDIGDAVPDIHGRRDIHVDKSLSLMWFARRLSDIVPNPWQAARIARNLVDRLHRAGRNEDAVYDRRSWLIHALRRHVSHERDRLARHAFMEKLRRKEIRFDLESGRPNFRMRETFEIDLPKDPAQMARNDGQSLQLSLFEPAFIHQFDSGLERSFARYLDEQKALQWWHRVAARQGGDYSLKGWKRDRIWPDFVAIAGSAHGRQHFLVYETKGAHLGGPDTDYKKRVLEVLEGAFDCGAMTVRDGPAKGIFRLVFAEAEFPAALAGVNDPA